MESFIQLHLKFSCKYDDYTPCLQKTVQNCFCQKFVKFLPTLIIFGTQIAQRIGLCECTHFPPHLISVNTLPC